MRVGLRGSGTPTIPATRGRATLGCGSRMREPDPRVARPRVAGIVGVPLSSEGPERACVAVTVRTVVGRAIVDVRLAQRLRLQPP